MLSLCVQISPEALFQEIGGEGVILDLVSSTYFGLDAVGVRIWQLLQDNPDVQAACDILLTEFDVEPAQLEEDVTRLINQLREAGLVSVQ